ncbi:MAG: hypothetical protein IPN76_23605 [Saprospiraceae bacterium]|nr:hypothetical protein [Saprospiraceae bacterium]
MTDPDDGLKEALKTSSKLTFEENNFSEGLDAYRTPTFSGSYNLESSTDFFTMEVQQQELLYDRVGLFKGIVVDYSKETPIDQGYRNVVKHIVKDKKKNDARSKPVRVFYKKPRLSGFYETTYSFEESQRKSQETGIFNLSFGLSASYSGPVVSVGGKAGFSYGKESLTEKNSFFKEISIVSSFFLPKIELSFDTLQACASDDLMAYLEKALGETNELKRFDQVNTILLSYGQFVPTSLIIGARLYSSDTKKIEGTDTIENVLTKYSAEFKVSASAGNFEGGAEGKMNKEDSSKSSEQKKSEAQSLQFNAVGGEGAFIAEKEQWVASTADSKGWGLVRFDNLVPVIDVLPEDLKNRCIELFDYIVNYYPIEELLSKGAHFLFHKGYFERFGMKARPKTFLIKNTQGGKNVLGVKAVEEFENNQQATMSLYDGASGDFQEWYITNAGKVILKASYDNLAKFVLSIDNKKTPPQLVITQDGYFENQVWSLDGGLFKNVITSHYLSYDGNNVKLVEDLQIAKQTTWMLVTESDLNQPKKPKLPAAQTGQGLNLAEVVEGSDTLESSQCLKAGKSLVSKNNHAMLTLTAEGIRIEWGEGSNAKKTIWQKPIASGVAAKIGILNGAFVAMDENNKVLENLAPGVRNLKDIQLMDSGNFEAIDDSGEIVWESQSVVYAKIQNTGNKDVVSILPKLDYVAGSELGLQSYVGGDHQLWYVNRKHNIVSKYSNGNQKLAITEITGLGYLRPLIKENMNYQLWDVQSAKKAAIQNRITKSKLDKGATMGYQTGGHVVLEMMDKKPILAIKDSSDEKWELLYDENRKDANMLIVTKNPPSSSSFIKHEQLYKDGYFMFVFSGIKTNGKKIEAVRLSHRTDPNYNYSGYYLLFLEFKTTDGMILSADIGSPSKEDRQNYVSDGLGFPDLLSAAYIDNDTAEISLMPMKGDKLNYSFQFQTKDTNGNTTNCRVNGFEFVNPSLPWDSKDGITTIDTEWVSVPKGNKVIGISFTKISLDRLGPCLLSVKE